MAKYRVLKTFRDKETKEIYKANQEIDVTVKRADEIAKTLKGKGVFLERVDEEPPKE